MTRHEALTALLAKVEDGTIKKGHSGQFKALGFSQMSRALAAYSGSLDSAKALHEAVLPEWHWVWSSWGRGHVTPRENKYSRLASYGNAPDPARAWLIAILKALIAMEGDHA